LAYVGRRIEVLLVDESAERLSAMKRWLTEFAPPGTVRVTYHTSAAPAAAVARARVLDLAIVPAQPRALSEGAVDLLAELLKLPHPPYICVNAAEAPESALERATAEGAQVIQTAPLEREDALRLLLCVADRLHPAEPARSGRVPQVAVVDDSRVHLADWRNALKGDAALRFFSSPADFWAEAERDRELVSSLDVVVVDYLFLDHDVDGVAFARALKGQRADLPVCLSTSGYGLDAELVGAIDVVLDKSAISWPTLLARVNAARGPRGSCAAEARETN
jgi:CheY-like chemotaxis protein